MTHYNAQCVSHQLTQLISDYIKISFDKKVLIRLFFFPLFFFAGLGRKAVSASPVRLSPAGLAYSLSGGPARTQLPLARQPAAFDSHFTDVWKLIGFPEVGLINDWIRYVWE